MSPTEKQKELIVNKRIELLEIMKHYEVKLEHIHNNELGSLYSY